MGDTPGEQRGRGEVFIPPAPSLLGNVWQRLCSSAALCFGRSFSQSHGSPRRLYGLSFAPPRPGNHSHYYRSLGTLPSFTGSLKSAHSFVGIRYPLMCPLISTRTLTDSRGCVMLTCRAPLLAHRPSPGVWIWFRVAGRGRCVQGLWTQSIPGAQIHEAEGGGGRRRTGNHNT